MKISEIIFFCSLYALLNVSAASIIKYKLLTSKINTLHDFFWFLVDFRMALVFLLIMGSMFFFMKALSLFEFSFVIPIATSINFIFTVLLGVLLFQDHLTMGSYSGFILILIGIVLLTKSYG